MRTGERGQASLEWIGLVLLVGCAFAGVLAFAPSMDGRPLGAALARVFVCAVGRDCGAEHAALARAYGERDAALVRSAAPSLVYERGTLTLPVDWRRCRSHRCSDAPDDPDLDASRAKRGGAPATAFTHVIHRGRTTYVQYWFYYPDSPSTWMHALGLMRALHIHSIPFVGSPYHEDDWEGYQVRIDPDGKRWVRATAHHGYQWCKHIWCKNDWGPATGWTRISRGSHAGHIPLKSEPGLKRWGVTIRYKPLRPGAGLRERSTTAPNLRLVPIETLDTGRYRPRAEHIAPPWKKSVYTDPESKHT
jgi:hypothetical protein